MITCLTDSIGLTGCGSQSPVSGLFLNSLPGISTKSLEYLSDSEQKNYLGVYHDIQVRAQARLMMDVYKNLSKEYSISNITQSIDLGTVIDTTVVRNASSEYRGIIFDLDYSLDNTNFKTSSLQNHYFQLIKFYAPVAKLATDIKIFDADTDVLFETFTQDLILGWNTITLAINKNYSCRRIFLAVDSSTFNSVKLSLPSSLNYSYSDCEARVRGGYVTIGHSISTFSDVQNTFGFSCIYGVRCKFDNIICYNKDVFYQPYWYLLGSETMQEALSSERVNQFVVKRKQNAELKAYYDTEYDSMIKEICDSLNLDTSDCCLDCGGDITVREANTNFFTRNSNRGTY